ncbi:aminoglycoside 6-adenylyltransferase [Gracilibacillus ureilyticus]|uniref:Aminoglycoside 6-adenylyltransferase n=1 Tax=Gracilibacillus ureilyticus TaxID=531814 RepID=A0A1H9TBF3_9BACI|nr:aminoglycoside 6-adenylyltransferase [Gracilibacillus ureilyticus]SER94552.1 aminoglycoside 6-adenylyltransferase [Gracilibacillus ureilyticus]
MKTLTHDVILERFLKFVSSNEDIKVVLMVGSRARQEKPADMWSDLDLVIFTENPDILIHNENWLTQLETPMITFIEKIFGDIGLERRVLFENGVDVDFAVFPIEKLQQFSDHTAVRNVLSKGVKVLADKGDYVSNLFKSAKNLDRAKENAGKIEMDVVKNMVNDFWYHSVLVAKKLRRGELLDAKVTCDVYMKNIIISFLKWSVMLKNEGNVEPWHGVRFFEEWADDKTLQSFQQIYAYYDKEDIWSALNQTMNLFHQLAVELYDLLYAEYPLEAEQYARTFVESDGNSTTERYF